MLNINEEDVKKAIIQKVSDDFLNKDDDLSSLIATEVKNRLDKIFIDRAQAQIEAAINNAVQGSFNREYQKITAWGEKEGPKTSIRAELEKTISGYWHTQVEPKTGKPSTSYNGTITRAEYVMTTVCAQDFSEKMRESALAITGALKDGFRNQMARQLDGLLDSLFHIKSLQDQGKVEKPY